MITRIFFEKTGDKPFYIVIPGGVSAIKTAAKNELGQVCFQLTINY